MTPVQQVVLVLSPHAADELAGYVERGYGRPRVLDGIAIECRSQLANLTPPNKAGDIASAMAQAARAAVIA